MLPGLRGITPTESDPYFSNVSLLAHFEGANGATSFVDSGPLGLTITRAGNAKLSTSDKPFGGSSLLLDGAGDYCSFPAGSQFAFGTGNFTIELWIKTSQTDHTYVLSPAGSNNWILRYNFTSSGSIEWLEGATNKIVATGTGLNNGNWHHLAVSRNGSTVRMFLDGVQIGSYTTSFTFGSSSGTLYLGRWPGGVSGEEINGNVKDVRITKGVGRYTVAFTPILIPFPDA